MSLPLLYRKSLPHCREAAKNARAHQFELVETHA